MKKKRRCIRLITLNTWKGDGLYSWRLQQMAQELFLLQPDVLLLQESVSTEDRTIDTAGFLADFLQLQCIYAPARYKKRNIEEASVNCYSGLAVLTSGSIEKHWTDRLPSVPEDGERIALSVQIDCEFLNFIVTNIHLTHLAGADSLRNEQLKYIISTNKEVCRNAQAWFCSGDFNTHLGSKKLQNIVDQTCVSVLDCYTAAGGDIAATTLLGMHHGNSSRRIDHIFSLTEEQQQIRFTNGHIVLNKADFAGGYPSDHAGVMVDIFP